MSRVEVHPDVLLWALSRSRKHPKDLGKRQQKVESWLSGVSMPTLKQLQDFAAVTATPFGYFFLPTPPDEPLPIPDFRTIIGGSMQSPSANLLDTLYAMKRRQDWLRETLMEEEAEPLSFVGFACLNDPPESIGKEMRRMLGLEDGWAASVRTWTDAVSELRRAIEQLGVITVINGVVGNNTHRKLDIEEFRGFALCDLYAPLIFVNGVDFKSAQMFTLAHELAHIWLGREGISGFEGIIASGSDVEKFCDAAAAEFLVPEKDVREFWPRAKREIKPYHAISRRCKVSPVVAARRVCDLHLISREDFFTFYNAYTAEEKHTKKTKGTGGDFYNNQNTRVGERFAMEVIRAAKEGRIPYRDAYTLTDLYGRAFDNYVQHLGFDVL